MAIRIGFGYDIHRLVTGKELFLGGIQIPSEKGCFAHSDGDVLIHAICDALLGAANLRDIGYHFPDTSSEFKGIDSKILLKRTIDLLKNNRYKIINIDSTICLEAPKIKDLISQMADSLSNVTGIPPGDISIKATTNEKIGDIGEGEAICAFAVVLIEKA